jgi:ABC-2 type transport system permease protein
VTLLAPGSTVWLLRHELRLSLRGLLAGRARGRAGMIWATVALPVLLMAVGGAPLGFALRDVEMPMTPAAMLIAGAVTAMVFTLMLSQTLAAAVEALYLRADLDLLFSSPIAARKVLTVRFLGVALSVCAVFAFFLAPFVLPIAVFGHPAWLASLLVLLDIGLAASAAGLLLAAALFRLIGPRRTRTVGQVLAALIGAAFFLASQARNILGGVRAESLFVSLVRVSKQTGFHLLPGADLPLRAVVGEPLPLLIVTAVGVGAFLLANTLLGRAFARDAASASGADTARSRARGGVGAFAGGAFAVTLRKELRLLARDPALLSQVLLRVLYMLPLGFVLLRQAGSHQSYVLPGGAAALVVLAGHVAGSLAWVTISAEDAPDLLACAPAGVRTLRRAKLAAAFLPTAVMLAIVLVPLLVLAPWVGLVATAGCAAATVASGYLNLWWQKPGKRADFRRRRASSWLVAMAELFVGLLIAAATGLLAAGVWWAVIPAALAALITFGLRRSDTRIQAALRAA